MRDDERTNEQLKIEILSQWKLEAESRKKRKSDSQSSVALREGVNKTIKDGDIAPWKDFNKEKRKRNQIRPYFEMGRIVKRLHFLRRPSRLRRSSRVTLV